MNIIRRKRTRGAVKARTSQRRGGIIMKRRGSERELLVAGYGVIQSQQRRYQPEIEMNVWF